MKYKLSLTIIILSSLIGCNESKSQNGKGSEQEMGKIEIKNIENDCEIGKEEAEIDFHKNDLGLYFYGLPNPRFNTWVRLMKQEYSLKVKGGSDIIDKKGDCYNQVMRKRIKEKFGENAFERIETKLDSLYNLGLGDKEPEFVGGEPELTKYIYCNIEDELLSDNENVPIVVIQILIRESGEVENKGIVFQNKFAKQSEKYEQRAVQIIEQMPNWIPAIENEKKVDFGVYRIPIKFEKERKKENCG